MVIFSDDLRTDSGRMLEQQIQARVPDARILYADARSAAAMKPSVVEAVEAAERVIAAVYVVPTAGKSVRAAGGGFKNSVSMDDATGSLLTAVLDHAAPRTVVLAMGNPYVVRRFPRDRELFVRVLQCHRVGNRRREGDLRRDPDPRSSAGYNSRHRIPRRGDRTPRPARLSSIKLSPTQLRRFPPCSALKCSTVKCSAVA